MTVIRSWLAVCLFVACWSSLPAQEVKLVADTEPLSPQEQLAKFHLPPGFKIELIAAEPDVRKPMNLKFDAAGRLFFTQSIEYPWPVGEGQTGRDTIRVMTDTNDDGVPDQTSVFAEGLNIPIGLTPVFGGLLGYSIPTLHFFPDADANGVADQRTEFYRSFGFRDTHGMCSSLNWWIDGWVYGCHGFSNESKVAGQDGKPVVMQSGNTYRLKPDGSHIEYISHGQVNPFGMCFDPLGNQYTSDCHTKPAYLILRGAYYPSFGKPHDGLGFGPELMQHLHGSTGIAGIVYYDADHFPAEFRDNLIIGNPVTGRINRDTLAWTGSTAKAIEQPDFLSCDDEWFRPVDIQLAPDGSLYVADFYNRIIGHYEVPLTHPGRDRERGRIWRISYVGEDGQQRAPRIPDLTKSSAAELIAALAHSHQPVRVQATHQLVHRIGKECATALTAAMDQPKSSPLLRTHGLWVLERLGLLDDLRVQKLSQDPDRLVRVHLAKALAERPDLGKQPVCQVLGEFLSDEDPFVCRAAADGVGRHPVMPLIALQALLQTWEAAAPGDELLVHTTRIASRDILRAHPDDLQKLIKESGALSGYREQLEEVALGLADPSGAELLWTLFQQQPWPDRLAEQATQHVCRYLAKERLPELAKLTETYRTKGDGLQLAVLRAAQRGSQERGQPLPTVLAAWAEETGARLLIAKNDGPARAGLELVRDLRLSKNASELTKWLAVNGPHPALRPLVLDTLASVNHPDLITAAAELFDRSDVPSDHQQHAAQVLGGLNREESRAVLLAKLKTAPQVVALAIARGLSLGKPGGEALVTAIEKGQASPRLLQDATIEQRLRAAGVDKLDDRRKALLEGLPADDERVVQLIQSRRGGFQGSQTSAERGVALFKKHCAGCHKINNEGGKVGPELDGVGLRGLDRLLEDTLDPNRNVDAAFRATVIALNNGQVVTGLALREEGQVLVMADDQGQEKRIALADIDERNLVKLSPMPANVAEKISESEFNDLLAYLLAQRTAKPKSP